MTGTLGRLFQPKSIAVIGGGAWPAAVVDQARRLGFRGDIYAVHPKAGRVADIPAVPLIEDLPVAPDAAFVGINRHSSVEAVGALAAQGAGGAVVFASGFREAEAEAAGARDLEAALVAAAGDMPILGPNCYGYLNALDRACIWPDQHGMEPVDRGVAILTQSSNIAINLTNQQRALPIGFMGTCGNMARISQAQIAMALLEDPRITAIGLHVEGFADPGAWHTLAMKACDRGVPLVVLKVGRSNQARAATVSHTASLAGSDAGADALLKHLGIPRVNDLPSFLETLKLLHNAGPLQSNRIATISCSGGEASLAADTAHGRDLVLPPLTETQSTRLRAALGPNVALANPLDYHTYIWRDTDAIAATWTAMADADLGLTLTIVDYPITDASDWECATQAAIRTRAATGRPFAMVATLPELMPPGIASVLTEHGVIPMHGLTEALSASEAAARVAPPQVAPPMPAGGDRTATTLTEADAKAALSEYGLDVPRGGSAVRARAAEVAARLRGPLALKSEGQAHKSESGGVILGLTAETLPAALDQIDSDRLLVEEMVPDGVAELLVGITRDPAHGFVLTLGAGGTLTEILGDAQSLLVPATPARIEQALRMLRCAPLLAGYRGKPAASIPAIMAAIDAIQTYVIANADTVEEVEVNPLIATSNRAVAADALIRKAPS